MPRKPARAPKQRNPLRGATPPHTYELGDEVFFRYVDSDPLADGFLKFVPNGANTLVQIDADGAGSGGPTAVATLLNATLTAANTDNYLV